MVTWKAVSFGSLWKIEHPSRVERTATRNSLSLYKTRAHQVLPAQPLHGDQGLVHVLGGQRAAAEEVAAARVPQVGGQSSPEGEEHLVLAMVGVDAGPAHLDGAASEKIVPSGHRSHKHSEGIAELFRILRLHLEDS